MPNYEETPFEDLPEALVDELISQSEQAGDFLYRSFDDLQKKRHLMHKSLNETGLLKKDTDIGYSPIPTTCGVDGSYAIERLLSTDLVAAAAVAVEGLTPPSETRHWEQPHHKAFIQPLNHDPDTGTVARAIMMTMELELAYKSPHEVVFLDGSLTTPLIYLNQALNKLDQNPGFELREQLLNSLEGALFAYKVILTAMQTDRIWCGVPKYTVRRELGNQLNWSSNCDDKALLTFILSAGELIKPMPLQKPDEPWHLKLASVSDSEALVSLGNEVTAALGHLFVIYYRPTTWTPVLRIEVSPSVAENQHRLAMLLQAIKHQCSTPSIFEPFPLYMADRMVKHLSRAIPAFRQVATQHMAYKYEGDIGEIFFAMHGYRTEAGR